MDQNAAWRVIRTAFQCAADLQALLKFVKDNSTADEYHTFAMGIASAIDSINVQLTDRALAAHPDLAAKIESDLTQFGRVT